MKDIRLQEINNRIYNASPLELPAILEEIELFDKKESRKVLDEIYEEFRSQDRLVDNIVGPVFISFVDGFLELTPATKKLRKKGITAQRIVDDCRSFSYENPTVHAITPDGYIEFKNMREKVQESGNKLQREYERNKYEDKTAMNQYKEKSFSDANGRKNAIDEYTGERNIYKEQNNPDNRRKIEGNKHSQQAEVDHIIPLKKIHENFKENYALSDIDIKNIANQETNLALTSARINRGSGASDQGGKFDKPPIEFVKDQKDREKNGLPNLGLKENQKDNMLKMGLKAQNNLEKDANKAVLKNLVGHGTGDTAMIWSTNVKNATDQSKEYMIGNVILFIFKPLYYELADIFKNGLKDGVQTQSTKQAIKIRFGRLKKYVVENAKSFFGDSLIEFIKGFMSSLVEGIISLFVGIFKQVLKVIKEGIKIFTQAGKVLFGKQSQQMTASQKGDAIIKILGGGIISICGVGIEALLNKIAIPDPWSVMISTILSGIASSLFMLLLDKLDLFNTKAEARHKRIEEIFNERINDIKKAEETYNNAALETMRTQELEFFKLRNQIWNGLESNNINAISDGAFKLASFMKVELGYTNLQEFEEEFDRQDEIIL